MAHENDYYASKGFRPVLGPYDVYGMRAVVPQEVTSLPFEPVRGGVLCVQVSDNLAVSEPAGSDPEFSDNRFLACAIVEVALVGIVRGVDTELVRQHMRELTGPLVYTFAEEQNFETLSIRARMLRGGSRFPNGLASLLFNGPQFYARLTVTINSRKVQEGRRFNG